MFMRTQINSYNINRCCFTLYTLLTYAYPINIYWYIFKLGICILSTGCSGNSLWIPCDYVRHYNPRIFVCIYIEGLHTNDYHITDYYTPTLPFRFNMLGRNQQVQVKVDSNSASDAGKEFGFEWCFKPCIVILRLQTGAPVDRPSNSPGQQKEQQHRSTCSCLAFYGVPFIFNLS